MITGHRLRPGADRLGPKRRLLVGRVLVLSGADRDVPAAFVAITADALTIDVPATVEAGQPIPMTVDGLVAGVEVEIRLEAGYGSRPLTVHPTSDTVAVNLPPIVGPASGTALLTVTQAHDRGDGDHPNGDGRDGNPTERDGESEVPRRLANTTETDGGDGRPRVATAEVIIEPGKAVDPVDAYLGPRTVVADGQHFVMIVTVPTDGFGNPVAAGTRVDHTVTRADLVEDSAETRHRGRSDQNRSPDRAR